MGILGLLMRLTQADVLGISPSGFYELLTLHGAGMLTGALLATMGGMWYALRTELVLSVRRAVYSYAAINLGAVFVLIAVQPGGFATGWTFLWPLPFFSVGEWGTWATTVFLIGILLVGVGFFIFCLDVLGRVTARYGGLANALGFAVFRGKPEQAPPPQLIGATVIAVVGSLATAAAVVILAALFGRLFDTDLQLDALWAKNLTFFFGHSYANLIIYLAVGGVYVLLPRYAGRPWKTTKPFVIAWLGTLTFVVGAYFHHLYMDFVQPDAFHAIGFVSSSAAALPVLVVTVFTGMMLVWGSQYRWTLASSLIYLGFAGWVIGGAGAVLDSLIPLNFKLHNTLWVPAHFHTYLMLAVMLWSMAAAAYFLERAADRPASRWLRVSSPGLMLIGGYGLVAVWYVSGALGVPRRYAVQPFGSDDWSLYGSIFVFIFAAGFLLLLVAFAQLGLAALRRSRAGEATMALAGNPGPVDQAVEVDVTEVKPASGLSIVTLAALGVAGLAALIPFVVEASETNFRWHHLAHATLFASGAALGLGIASVGGVWGWIREHVPGDLALATVIVAPLISLLAMTPRFYGNVESSSMAHFGYHLAFFVLLGFATGFAASRLGRVPAWAVLVLASGMGILYAAGVIGT